MPDKKLTDNEIIKALKYCAGGASCANCYYSVNCDGTDVQKQALDLINRLQAENERKDKNYIDLLKTSSERADIISELSSENERLKNHIQEGIDLAKQMPEMIELAKAEAYKECIEKVKPIIDEIVDIMFDDNKSTCVIHDCVKPSKIAYNSEICILENKQAWEGRLDNLLKELVGDTDES